MPIDKSLAQGLRRSHARQTSYQLTEFSVAALKMGAEVNALRFLERFGLFCGKRRRKPVPNFAAGWEVVFIDHTVETGQLRFVEHSIDRRGFLMVKRQPTLLLQLSQHATESMYQRLKTTDPRAVISEAKPIGVWLVENSHLVRSEEKGLLVSPNGVFPIVRGDLASHPILDERCYWLATTWISFDGMEVHTPMKARLAHTVKSARAEGLVFVQEN